MVNATTLLHTTRKVLPMLLAITLGACGSHSSSEEPPAASRCGDDRIDLGEECDGTELGGRTCQSFRRDSSGTLSCGSDCRFNDDLPVSAAATA
jgi:hypothetical protein